MEACRGRIPEIAAAVDKRLRGVGGAAQIDPADLVGKGHRAGSCRSGCEATG